MKLTRPKRQQLEIHKILAQWAQASPVAAIKSDSKVFGFKVRYQRAFAPRNARSSRTNKGERSRAPLPSVIGSVAPAHSFTHAVPPAASRFPPANARPKRNSSEFANGEISIRFVPSA